MKYYILYDPEKCCACGACSVACMDQNDIDVSKGQLPFRTVCEFEDPGQMEGSCEYLSISCRHCADAPCVAGCPTGCLQKDLATGMTVYDRSKCIGCHSCAMACPFGIPRFDLLDGKLVKCDGCFVRLESGMAPACVRACAFGALICVDEAGFEKLEQEKRVSSLLKAVNHV
ncbi:MAG: 4Fe-4S binding protein [Clostridiales bacterium]|nr:4Fe-4S binding protein [Clostridiales bacterium]MDY4182657.1 4Fe-4S dicluster domain-containing protein [Pseudoflavonifractor sp.]